MAFTVQFQQDRWEIIVEDDDRTAYAYLVEDGQIVSDVWLANRVVAGPPEWRLPNARDLMPFLNPDEFVLPGRLQRRASDPDLLRVDWRLMDAVPRAVLTDRDEILAVLAPGARPGWSVDARRDGPLARLLSGAPGAGEKPREG